jgi:hypothetical protein
MENSMRLWTRDARAHGSCQRSAQGIFSTKPAQLLNNFQAFLGTKKIIKIAIRPLNFERDVKDP